MARLRVLIKIMANIVYSKTGDVTKAHSLYCIGFFGIYLRTGLAPKANSIQFLWNEKKANVLTILSHKIHISFGESTSGGLGRFSKNTKIQYFKEI